MNIPSILNQIEEVDPEVFEKISPRRNVLKNFGTKVAVAALPFALGSLLNKAYAGETKNTTAITDILNFALKLEYLERDFYNTGLGSSSLAIPSIDLSSFQNLAAHEAEHVIFLINTINSLGATPVAKPNFDFTAGGLFPTVFSDYNIFLAVSQTFEDTGVRAYKGQAANLMSNATVLTAALQIHSTEARHASHVRGIRRRMGANVKPWITGNAPGIAGNANQAAAVQKSYNGEDNVNQLGVSITSLNGLNGLVTFNTATESFDEPLDMPTVLGIVAPFFV